MSKPVPVKLIITLSDTQQKILLCESDTLPSFFMKLNVPQTFIETSTNAYVNSSFISVVDVVYLRNDVEVETYKPSSYVGDI